jgi:two-component system, LytTR family, sensor kinase
MRKNNCRIGFDDRIIMLIAIPLLGFVIPIVFMGCRFDRYPLFSWDKYVSTVIITSILWVGSRQIMIYSRKRYPLFNDVRRRLWFQSANLFVFTLVFINLLGFLVARILKNDGAAHFTTDILISSNSAAFFCTIMITAIYESVYFMNELRQSVEEAEQLKRETLSAQLNALRTQVNPHFLFNNLNTLISIIPDEPELAVDFVQQLSKLYRHILEVKDEKSISLEAELEVLKAYAFLLKTRFGHNLEIDIDVANEKLKNKIVPLSLQILMENAIKHNIVSADKPLKIDVYAQNGSLVVSNNLQKKNQLFESTGIGLDNIRNRYRLLSDKMVEVTESENNFTVSIPLLAN